MLNERRATRFDYDAQTDTARLVVHEAAVGSRSARDASLLLDAQKALVGVDLREEGDGMGPRARVVVMLRAHEDVAQFVDARVEVGWTASGDVAEVRIAAASRTFEPSRPA